jgi:hypothetical protein
MIWIFKKHPYLALHQGLTSGGNVIEKQRDANIGYDALYQNKMKLFSKEKALCDECKILTDKSSTY